MKNKLLLTGLVGLMTTFSSLSYAQACQQPAKEDNFALLIFSKSQQTSLVKQLLNIYCYRSDFYETNKMSQPFFFAKDLETVKAFEAKGVDFSKGRNIMGQDYLTSLLLSHVNYEKFDSEQKTILNQSAQRYSVKLSNINESPISVEDREEIIEYITPKYKSSITNRDVFYNNTAGYAVLTLEPTVLEGLIGASPASTLLRKNKEGFSAYHFAFAKKYIADKTKTKKSTEEVNDILLEHLDKRYLSSLSVNGVGYFDFAEVMKENNPDLYEKLKKKFAFESVVTRFSPASRDLSFEKFNEAMDYVTKMKKFDY